MAKVNKFNSLSYAINKVRRRHEKGCERALKKIGLFIQRESQLIVPIDTAALKNSAFTRAEGHGFETVVTVGYTQFYAVYVHEDMQAQHAEGKTAKFLERPIREKRKEIKEIMRQEAR